MKKIFFLAFAAMMALTMLAQYPTRVYLVGASPTGWEMKGTAMYTNLTDGEPNGTYAWVGDLSEGELKMLYGNDWVPGFGPVTDGAALQIGSNAILTRPDYDAPDNKWAVAAGRYQLTLSLIDSTLTVADGTGMESLDGNSQEMFPDNLYIVGSGCGAGWNAGGAYALTRTGYGKFTGRFMLYAYNAVEGETHNEIKFLCQQDWGPHFGPANDGEVVAGNGTCSIAKNPDGNDNKYHLQLTESKEYNITIDLVAGTVVFNADATPVTHLDALNNAPQMEKVFINGRVCIRRNNELFTLDGRRIK